MKFVDAFPRRIDALPDIVRFADLALSVSSLDHDRRQAVQIVLEELLTNMIKYAPQGAPAIAVEIVCSQEAVDVTLIDRDVDGFDPTRAPAPRIDGPLDDRRPGGLGIHLVRRLTDTFDYTYDAARREGRTRFRIAPRTASETDAHD